MTEENKSISQTLETAFSAEAEKEDQHHKKLPKQYSASEEPAKKEEIPGELKKKEQPKIKKYEAVAFGVSAPISKKHSMYICSFIKNKPIDQAIEELNEVLKFKKAIPFKGEIPHRKELGGKPGRFPINASRYFIKLLKGLKGNALSNGLELETTRIALASACWDSRPQKSGGRFAKRTYIILKAKENSRGNSV